MPFLSPNQQRQSTKAQTEQQTNCDEKQWTFPIHTNASGISVFSRPVNKSLHKARCKQQNQNAVQHVDKTETGISVKR